MSFDWFDAIHSWQAYMERETSLAAKSMLAYTTDAKHWATWAVSQSLHNPDEVTTGDVREYRDEAAASGSKPSTVNRRLTSISLFLEHLGRGRDNPARRVDHLYDAPLEEDGRALGRNEWNAVRRAAERTSELADPRGASIAEALIALFRYAGPRVNEIVRFSGEDKSPFTMRDLTITPRTGEIHIRKGKGQRSRTVPLVLEARESIRAYLRGPRETLVHRWADRGKWSEEKRQWWLLHPDAPVFLGQRGPLTTRGVRAIIAKIGEEAKLDFILGPHDLRATMINALLDPGKYGLVSRIPTPITVVARLVGHANVETTARYARPSQDDLMRFMVGQAGD